MFEKQVAKPKRKYTGNAKQIYDLLTESTGGHLLDSGDAYGRAWSNNRQNDFDKKPPAVFTVDHDGKLDGMALNLFHVLNEWLDYDKEIQREFERFNKKEFMELEAMGAEFSIDEKLEKFIESRDGSHIERINTYNEETMLSGTVDIVKYRDDERGEDIIFVSHHGGCDVRAGYTWPKAFTCVDWDVFPSAWSDALVSCECGNCDVRTNTIDDMDEWDGDKTEHGWPVDWVKSDSEFGAAYCKSCKQTVSADISRH